MIYPESLEHKIGFDLVRDHVARLCSSPVGADHCRAMTFSGDYQTVSRQLAETSEMLAIIAGDSGFPSGNIHDRRAALLALRAPGTWPSLSDIPGLRASLGTLADIVLFFAKLRRDETNATPYPALDALAADLTAFPDITAAIDRIVDRHGEIKDNASPELSEIRRSMAAASASINSAMRRVMAVAVKE